LSGNGLYFSKKRAATEGTRDLVGLVGLVLELVHVAPSDGNDLLGRDGKELTMSWHEFILQRLCVGLKTNSFDLWTAATKLHQFEDDTFFAIHRRDVLPVASATVIGSSSIFEQSGKHNLGADIAGTLQGMLDLMGV
jgi:hypothetical protein